METNTVNRKDLRKLNTISKILKNLISAYQALEPETQQHLNKKFKINSLVGLNTRIQNTMQTLKTKNSDER